MNQEQAANIESKLGPHARVVDVGGGAAPYWRADWVIDAIPYEAAGRLHHNQQREQPQRYRPETWVQLDLCDRVPWPFQDGYFDFAVCSHLLEDVRDPIWVCSELSRIAKAGYVEVPSRMIEQSLGIEHPRFAGYHHHRWLVAVEDGTLVFRHKPHLLHVTRDAIVAKVGIARMVNPRYQITTLFWERSIPAREMLEFDEYRVVEELRTFAGKARRVPDLVVSSQRPFLDRFKRALYFRRLARGRS